jgi:hypothetical protein
MNECMNDAFLCLIEQGIALVKSRESAIDRKASRMPLPTPAVRLSLFDFLNSQVLLCSYAFVIILFFKFIHYFYYFIHYFYFFGRIFNFSAVGSERGEALPPPLRSRVQNSHFLGIPALFSLSFRHFCCVLLGRANCTFPASIR